MKKYFIVLLIFVLASISPAQTNSKIVKFVVTARGLSKEAKVYITGNNPRLGNWNPGSIQLKKLNDSTWSKEIRFNDDESIEYKFTLGSWQNEALDSNGNLPPNLQLIVSKDTTIKLKINSWKKGNIDVGFKGQITGTVKYFRNMKGNGIKPRDIIVWLPPSYKTDQAKRYPVLYMHDGQNLFDPNTASFGVDWQLDESADSLIKSNSIKEIIIVGIYNTPDRMTEYLDTPLGHAYMNFIVTKLKPFIDKNFRTLPDRDNTATGGSSAGGLISFMLLWDYPDVFSQAACLSPAFHIDRINFVKNVLNYSGKKKQIRCYIDNGTKGIDSLLLPGTKEMISALENKGYKLGKDIEFYFAKGATHNEAAWSKRNWRYLEFMFGK